MQTWQTAGLAGLLAIAAAGSLAAQETRIQRSDLPAAVEHTVAAQSTGATLRGFSRETEDGQTFYEAEMTVRGHSRDVLMDEQGNVVEVEEQMDMDSLPASVRKALAARAGSGTVARVESLTKKGKLVAYEAVVQNGNKRHEIQVGPNGEALDHEE